VEAEIQRENDRQESLKLNLTEINRELVEMKLKTSGSDKRVRELCEKL
jgi:hypothetical protein